MPSTWFYTRDRKKKIGPVTDSELRTLAQSGQLLPTDMVLCEGTAQWVVASNVKGLFPSPPPASPAPPPPVPKPAAPAPPPSAAAAEPGHEEEQPLDVLPVVPAGSGGKKSKQTSLDHCWHRCRRLAALLWRRSDRGWIRSVLHVRLDPTVVRPYDEVVRPYLEAALAHDEIVQQQPRGCGQGGHGEPPGPFHAYPRLSGLHDRKWKISSQPGGALPETTGRWRPAAQETRLDRPLGTTLQVRPQWPP